MNVLNRLAALSAAAVLTLVLAGPTSAEVTRSYVVKSDSIHVAGGTINCQSGCTVTVNDDGTTEIDTGNGESYYSDGTNLYGAP